MGSTEGSTSASVDLDDSAILTQPPSMTNTPGSSIPGVPSAGSLIGGNQGQLLCPGGQTMPPSGSPPSGLQAGQSQQLSLLHPIPAPVPASPAVTPGPDPSSTAIPIPAQQGTERREVQPQKTTPPGSPNFSTFYIGPQPPQTVAKESLLEPMELQLDYWLAPGKGTDVSSGGIGGVIGGTGGGGLAGVVGGGGGGKAAKGESNPSSAKSTLKTTFRSLVVQRLPPLGEVPSPHFLITFSTKEKKQKIMRLGKKKEKERENEPKSQVVEGVSRLICSPKTHNIPMRVCIDGTEWAGVKFFQLSAQWQTHIKHFPVAMFALPEPSA
ncbi:hypothetical protein J437_LFUL008769 [Ladona fulva]|uniref:Phosphofurin acidic cluster sorting protein 1/2 C-terminal domain-containing protein n=1 Tax=Ladona fulva TaxID=123851 RepID=A0A8K0K1A0_LADFU|nr:hypothetical protein J437_LFUL008769 [Ladona fulva]